MDGLKEIQEHGSTGFFGTRELELRRISTSIIKIGRKDDAIFATICARKEKMAKKKKYIYICIVGSMQLPGASIVESEILRENA